MAWRWDRQRSSGRRCPLASIFYPVCRLHFTDQIGIAVFVQASLKSRPKYWGLKKVFVKLSWSLWLMCRLYVEELPRTSTMIEQWLLYINWRQMQMHGLTIWLPLIPWSAWSQGMLKWTRYGSPRCVHLGFLNQVAFLEVRKCDLRLLFLLNHTNILFLSTWVFEPHRN